MFDFGKSLMTMNRDEQKLALEKATPGQRNTALEMGIGFKGQSKNTAQPRQQKRDAYHDLDRLNHIVEKENEAHDFFGKGLTDWQKGVTGKSPSKDAGTLKKQFDEYEQTTLADLPKGGKRHTALAETLPKLKDGFLKQGHQFALDKLNERSRSVLGQGLKRIAGDAIGAQDDETFQRHDDQAAELINQYVLSEASFDEKDADEFYDRFLKDAGVPSAAELAEQKAGAQPPEQRAQAMTAESVGDDKEAQAQPMAEKEEASEQEQTLPKSSSQEAREMEEKVDSASPENSTEAARLIGEWEKQTGNSAKDVEEKYRQKPGPTPTWIKDDLGKTEYYEKRARDFEERNPGKKAPDYYRDYGDKYVKRFDTLKPELSKEGQKWQEKAKDLLQFKMEQGLRSGEWDESKPEEFKEKAYDSHSEAYLEAGLAELPQEDIGKIINAVDVLDIVDPKALLESVQVAKELGINTSVGSAVSGLVDSIMNE